MPHAIALIRVSTGAQADEGRAGLESQRVEIRRIAAAHDLKITEWVELEGVSGAKVMADQRFTGLLARLEDPGIAGVIVAAWDRLMRPESLADYAILEEFRRTGTIVYTPTGPRSLESDRLLSVLETEIAHFERMKIRERTMRAKEAAICAGSGQSA